MQLPVLGSQALLCGWQGHMKCYCSGSVNGAWLSAATTTAATTGSLNCTNVFFVSCCLLCFIVFVICCSCKRNAK